MRETSDALDSETIMKFITNSTRDEHDDWGCAPGAQLKNDPSDFYLKECY